jgi:D-sedoheptulose 7-phosphate isomerase
MQSYIDTFLQDAASICQSLSRPAIVQAVQLIRAVRAGGGRLFILGVGGSAANAAHAVNDFRKLVQLEAYAPTDNVSELTARTNDEGWETVFCEWLKTSRLSPRDAVLIFSVGGGNAEKKISVNLIRALEYARQVGAKILGIVGRDGGYTAQVADALIRIPVINPASVTPHTEAFQAVIAHLLVSHPDLQSQPAKWESTH